MPNGYLVSLGANNALDSGDTISGGLVTFVTDTNLGTGQWIWSGTWSGTTFTNAVEPGVYYLATDGNVYFVPDYGPVDTLTSSTTLNPPSYQAADGDILGGGDDDLIDGSYTDADGDLIDNGGPVDDSVGGGEGDDTILSGGGADTVTGGGGADSILGGGGGDLIYGDTTGSLSATSESLNWTAEGGDGADLTGGFTQATGEMDVTVSFTDLGNNNPIFDVETTDTNYVGTGEPFNATSSAFLFGTGDGATAEITVDFAAAYGSEYADEVENVAFRINDIDWGAANHRDIVTVTAFDADGTAVAVTITPGAGMSVSGNTITSGDNAYGSASAGGSALIEIAGPVQQIVISYSNGLTNTQGINLTDIHFDTIPPAPDADTIDGQGGNDTIYGGAGNDDLTGANGADEVYGEAGDDTIYTAQNDYVEGGDGDDQFILTDRGEAGSGTITIYGAETGEVTGDTLDLNGLADRTTLSITNPDDSAGGLSGSVSMTDGTVVNFFNIENIICFTPETMILTPTGDRPVESLSPGDLVVTRDGGPMPIRWIGSKTVEGRGALAPIRLDPALIAHARHPLLVSPQHRMLVSGYRAELLFGEPEVLVAAKHLVSDSGAARIEERDEVRYIHLMLDSHQIIYANGAATESFHLADMGLSAIGPEACEEVFGIFPQLRADVSGYGPTARTCLRGREARLLAA